MPFRNLVYDRLKQAACNLLTTKNAIKRWYLLYQRKVYMPVSIIAMDVFVFLTIVAAFISVITQFQTLYVAAAGETARNRKPEPYNRKESPAFRHRRPRPAAGSYTIRIGISLYVCILLFKIRHVFFGVENRFYILKNTILYTVFCRITMCGKTFYNVWKSFP